MKKTIDLTNWREAVDFMVDWQGPNKSEYWTKENLISWIRKQLKKEIDRLWERNEINTSKWDECCWNDDVNKEFKEFFNISNKFLDNSKVEDEDYSLTDYELKKKYGQDWYDDNFYSVVTSIKENLSIDQLEKLALLMKRKYYAFWDYCPENDGSIKPLFTQYDTSEYSEYLQALQITENFEYKDDEEKDTKKMKINNVN